MAFLEADGLAEVVHRLAQVGSSSLARDSISAASASASTLSFSCIASVLRRPGVLQQHQQQQ